MEPHFRYPAWQYLVLELKFLLEIPFDSLPVPYRTILYHSMVPYCKSEGPKFGDLKAKLFATDFGSDDDRHHDESRLSSSSSGKSKLALIIVTIRLDGKVKASL